MFETSGARVAQAVAALDEAGLEGADPQTDPQKQDDATVQHFGSGTGADREGAAAFAENVAPTGGRVR